MQETSTQTAAVTATITGNGYATKVSPAPPHEQHKLMVDQSTDIQGGSATGPNPFTYLYAALAGCVAQTMYAYVSRKGWPLERAVIRVFPTRQGHDPVEQIDLRITLEGDKLTDEQRERIHLVAAKCPVHKTLEAGVRITDSAD